LSEDRDGVRAVIERLLDSNRRPSTIGQLVRLVVSEGNVDEEDVVSSIKEMNSDGSIVLGRPSYRFESFLDYLLTPTLSAAMWLTFVGMFTAILSILLIPDVFPFSIVRVVFVSAFLFFLPGHSVLQVVFQKTEGMDRFERFALSAGMSLAVVPLIGLVVNYTPLGIRLEPVTLAVSLFTIVVALLGEAKRYWQLRQLSP